MMEQKLKEHCVPWQNNATLHDKGVVTYMFHIPASKFDFKCFDQQKVKEILTV